MMTPEMKLVIYYANKLTEACEAAGAGDVTSFARIREATAAAMLGHNMGKTYNGADAFVLDENGKKIEIEYKSTINSTCKGTYSGISNQPTWEGVVRYLEKEKVLPYKWHYFNRFNKKTGMLVESWRMTGKQVFDLLLPKLHNTFIRYKGYLQEGKKLADPRLRADINWEDIQTHGEQVKLPDISEIINTKEI